MLFTAIENRYIFLSSSCIILILVCTLKLLYHADSVISYIDRAEDAVLFSPPRTTTDHHGGEYFRENNNKKKSKNGDNKINESFQQTTTTTLPSSSSSSSSSLLSLSFLNNMDDEMKNVYNKIMYDSDFVEIRHCSFNHKQKQFNWTNFTIWIHPIIEKVSQKFFTKSIRFKEREQKAKPKSKSKSKQQKNEIQQQQHQQQDDEEQERIELSIQLETLQYEWTLQLLEMYATHSGWCDFSNNMYQPTLRRQQEQQQQQNEAIADPSIQEAGRKLQRIAKIKSVKGLVRIVYVIIAFKDEQHLHRLIQAIHMPQHMIIIHLDRKTSNEFYTVLQQQIVSQYENVIILRYGTIIYMSDSISTINFQIMDWLVNGIQLQYDYHITLGGAVYPLWNATDLSQHLYNLKGKRNIWLGEMGHGGVHVNEPQWDVLLKKRLLCTNHSLSFGISQQLFDEGTIPKSIVSSMRYKSNSGNQAIFSYTTVQRLVNDYNTKQLFAYAKYGCCCCIEERTWIAALHMIGLLDEAQQYKAMFQLWGGKKNKCRGTIKNAILDMDETKCYRIEDPPPSEYLDNNNEGSSITATKKNKNKIRYVWGNDTWTELIKARSNGVLFARKFHPDHA